MENLNKMQGLFVEKSILLDKLQFQLNKMKKSREEIESYLNENKAVEKNFPVEEEKKDYVTIILKISILIIWSASFLILLSKAI